MRIIDADYLAKLLREQKVKQTGKLTEGINKGLNTALSLARNPDACPTIDAEPVKHGVWLPQIVLGTKAWDCSECKTLGSPHWKRCPVCEAKMDGERKET